MHHMAYGQIFIKNARMNYLLTVMTAISDLSLSVIIYESGYRIDGKRLLECKVFNNA